MDILIRKATAADIDAVYTIFLEMVKSEDESSRKTGSFLMNLRKKKPDFEASAKQELLREFEEENAHYLVAVVNDHVVGYVRGSIKEEQNPFFETHKIGYFNALAVLSAHTGKGIASKLYRTLETWFIQSGCSQVHLEVFEHNAAIHIYEKWGYTTFNRTMAKKLQ